MLLSSSFGNFMTFLEIKFYLLSVSTKTKQKGDSPVKTHSAYISLINNTLADVTHDLLKTKIKLFL